MHLAAQPVRTGKRRAGGIAFPGGEGAAEITEEIALRWTGGSERYDCVTPWTADARAAKQGMVTLAKLRVRPGDTVKSGMGRQNQRKHQNSPPVKAERADKTSGNIITVRPQKQNGRTKSAKTSE